MDHSSHTYLDADRSVYMIVVPRHSRGGGGGGGVHVVQGGTISQCGHWRCQERGGEDASYL